MNIKSTRKINKLISVIMSTKDTNETMLRNAISSILNQTYANFEFIIICDGGKNDYHIAKSFNDSRIVIINHTNTRGLAASINEGIAISKGDYVARMDSDDISLPSRLQIQIAYMEKHQNVDICATNIKNFSNNTKTTVNLYNTHNGIQAQLFLGNCIAHPTIMIRKTFIDKNSIRYNESFIYAQDYELWTRCSKLGNIALINKICLLYRVHDQQISSAKLTEQNHFRDQVYARNLRELGLKCSSENFNNLVALHHAQKTNVSPRTLINFITEVLTQNQKLQIYNQNILTKYLYYRFFIYMFKQQHRITPKISSIILAIKQYVLKLSYNILLFSSKKHKTIT